jgi:hypothetical protein
MSPQNKRFVYVSPRPLSAAQSTRSAKAFESLILRKGKEYLFHFTAHDEVVIEKFNARK